MLIVQKYGGTSVADLERIKKVARHAAKTARRGNRVVVIVSAMAGETNRLLKLGQECIAKIPLDPPLSKGGAGGFITSSIDRELDALVSTGEQTSAALLAIAINNLGVPAVSMNASQVRIVSDSHHQRARIKYIETTRIKRLLSKGYVVIVTGFQGVDEDGSITTIGRGGSDTSAVAIAAALKADSCEIYSDVDGVYSADPRICKNARKVKRLSYEELLETAGAGAKVIHTHAVELAGKHRVPIDLRLSPSISPSPLVPARRGCSGGGEGRGEGGIKDGTKIARRQIDVDKVLVSTVTHTANEAKISIRCVPKTDGVGAGLFGSLARANINVDMISQNIGANGTSDISFTIAKHDLRKAMQITETAARRMGAGRVETRGDVAKVSIVGIGLRSHSGVAAMMFKTLSDEGIDIQMISASELRVSVVVDMRHMKRAVRALHRRFFDA